MEHFDECNLDSVSEDEKIYCVRFLIDDHVLIFLELFVQVISFVISFLLFLLTLGQAPLLHPKKISLDSMSASIQIVLGLIFCCTYSSTYLCLSLISINHNSAV